MYIYVFYAVIFLSIGLNVNFQMQSYFSENFLFKFNNCSLDEIVHYFDRNCENWLWMCSVRVRRMIRVKLCNLFIVNLVT